MTTENSGTEIPKTFLEWMAFWKIVKAGNHIVSWQELSAFDVFQSKLDAELCASRDKRERGFKAYQDAVVALRRIRLENLAPAQRKKQLENFMDVLKE